MNKIALPFLIMLLVFALPLAITTAAFASASAPLVPAEEGWTAEEAFYFGRFTMCVDDFTNEFGDFILPTDENVFGITNYCMLKAEESELPWETEESLLPTITPGPPTIVPGSTL